MTENNGNEARAEWERARERERAQERDPLGSVADEAAKLFDTLQNRAAREVRRGLIKGTTAGLGQAFGGGGGRKERDVWEEAVADHHDEYVCRACPVCRVIAARREAGGVGDHLAAAGGELFAAFRQAVDVVTRPAPPRRPREDNPDVEHIDLG
ncbi:DUF5304 domain-containing protein [Streptosporangium sp. KLBMP 9127]|nr:DUF5304 domain-containing protein [Streptosporangium sp. KLBMP 9127]